MRITRLGHATLLVETDDTRVLVDPGTLSEAWHGLEDLDAVLVTHQHADHVDPAAVARLPGATSSVRLVAEEATVPMLGEHGLDAEVVRPGDHLELGSLHVEVEGGRHALIHESVPRVGNVGFVMSERGGARLYHPGDSYAYPLRGVDILALPLTAPWAKVAETAEFLVTARPARAFPIHDAIVSEKGWALYLRLASQLGGEGVEIHSLGPTDSLDA